MIPELEIELISMIIIIPSIIGIFLISAYAIVSTIFNKFVQKDKI